MWRPSFRFFFGGVTFMTVLRMFRRIRHNDCPGGGHHQFFLWQSPSSTHSLRLPLCMMILAEVTIIIDLVKVTIIISLSTSQSWLSFRNNYHDIFKQDHHHDNPIDEVAIMNLLVEVTIMIVLVEVTIMTADLSSPSHHDCWWSSPWQLVESPTWLSVEVTTKGGQSYFKK